jgi:hypothetical protein
VGWYAPGISLFEVALNKSLRIAFVSSSSSKLFSIVPMSIELPIPLVDEYWSKDRVRLFLKADELSTGLGDLVQEGARPNVGRSRTWVTGTTTSRRRLAGKDQPLRKWVSRMLDWKRVPVEELVIPERVLREFKDQHLEQTLAVCRTKAWAQYDGLELGFTRGFLQRGRLLPSLSYGMLQLSRVRMLSMWDVPRRLAADMGTENEGRLTAGECPLCKNAFRLDGAYPGGQEPEWAHLLLTCSKLDEPRRNMLDASLRVLWGELCLANQVNIVEVFSNDQYRWVVAGLLIGGWGITEGEVLPGSSSVGDISLRTDGLRLYRLGWGHIAHRRSQGLRTMGFQPVARYLSHVVPRYYWELFGHEVGNIDDSGVSVADNMPRPLQVLDTCGLHGSPASSRHSFSTVGSRSSGLGGDSSDAESTSG